MVPLSFKPIPELKRLIADGILGDKHNVIVIWGELGLGKTTLMLKLLLWTALRFIFHAYDRNGNDVTGCTHNSLCEHWKLALSLVDFTFQEVQRRIKTGVTANKRIPCFGWDDLGVYFHKSTIQYMHPEVKDFFSKYNFVRPYLANLIITVPDIEFVPHNLLTFCTGDIWISQRGVGDFDRAKLVRNFWGSRRSWTKHYDGFDVKWSKAPVDVYRAYALNRHEHALKAFEKPEEVFVTSMPQTEEFTEEDSLFTTD